MEPQISNDENKNPKSLGHLGYNTAFKNNIHFKNNLFSKKLARTPLKSKMNTISSNQENSKSLKYPLLKQISTSNINQQKNISFNVNNYDEEDEYNKNALPDEMEDFMHINENKISIENDNMDINEINQHKKNDIKILENIVTPFNGYDYNYVLGAHFDDDNDIDNEGFNSKKKFDDYFNESDDIDINMSNSDN